jgi:hypothetical protein
VDRGNAIPLAHLPGQHVLDADWKIAHALARGMNTALAIAASGRILVIDGIAASAASVAFLPIGFARPKWGTSAARTRDKGKVPFQRSTPWGLERGTVNPAASPGT